MRHRFLGRTGLEISEIGLGTGSFGTPLMDQAAADRVVAAALEAGIDYIDTADVYGGVGRSEEMLGKALEGRRNQVVLATKVGLNTGPGPQDYGLSRDYIVRACESSLRRLRTEHIDVYQLHYPDVRVPIEETLRALDDLVRQGKVRYLGCSNFRAWEVCEAQLWADRCGLARIELVQDFYNLLYRELERELEPFCEKYDVSMTPYFPLAGGLLTDSYSRGVPPPPGSRGSRPTFRTWDSERNWSLQEQLKALAGERGMTLAQMAIAWLLSRRAICTVIAGADTPEHIKLNVAAADVQLSASDLQEIDRITLVDEDRSRPPIFRTQPPIRWPR